MQLHQVVMNLCTNAEYTMREKGGILVIGEEVDRNYTQAIAGGESR